MQRARDDGGRITDAELARAQVRGHAVASELAAANYHAAGAPPWAIQMRNTLQTEIQTVKSEIRRRLAHLIERSLLNSNLSCSFSARAMQSPEA